MIDNNINNKGRCGVKVKGIRTIIMIAILLIVGFLLYVFLPNFNQNQQVSVNIPPSIMEELKENPIEEKGTVKKLQLEESGILEEEIQLEDETDKDNPITEEIKDKVREVVEIASDLFQKDQKIVAIGDSLTQGVGDETENGGYVGILNHTFEDHHLNISVNNFGKKGNRSDQLLKRLEKDEVSSAIKEADIVLVTIGGNDIMKVVKTNFTNLTLEHFQEEKMEYVKRLSAIINKINELNPDTQIYLIGFYNPFESYFSNIEQLGIIFNNWNQAAKSVTDEYDNVLFIPTNDLFINSDTELLAEDQFHPNTNGYKLIAKRILEHLVQNNEE
jgi:lysophospholipase L1-like esterase